MAIKVDIRKAFDTMRWPFLLKVLECFGFDFEFCRWMEAIFQSVRISILFHNSSIEYSTCFRKVLQGDILSPLLFG